MRKAFRLIMGLLLYFLGVILIILTSVGLSGLVYDLSGSIEISEGLALGLAGFGLTALRFPRDWPIAFTCGGIGIVLGVLHGFASRFH